MKKEVEKLINELNTEQRTSLLKTIDGGHTAVLAVPGSGKTKTIVNTASVLVALGNSPQKILLLTFTKKASQELKSRIEKNLDELQIYSAVSVYTFHSLALRMIRRYGEEFVPEIREFKIIDEYQQEKLFNLVYETLIQELDQNNFFFISPEEKNHQVKKDLLSLKKEFFEDIKRMKTFNITMEDFKKSKNINTKKIDVSNNNQILYLAWERYEDTKISNKRIDFDDILTIFHDMLKTYEGFRRTVKAQFDYIIVDEYQDTSSQQMEIINLIKKNNLTVVGDGDQTIYTWRNANVDLINEFEWRYSATLVNMNKNYRSNEKINLMANSIIEKNNNRIKKEIVSTKKVSENDIISLEIFEDDEDEANFIIKTIEEKKNLGTIAVLYRNHKTVHMLEEKFQEKGVLYSKKGSTDIFNDFVIKESMMYLHFYFNDNEANLIKILASQKGVGEGTIKKIKQTAYVNKTSIFEAAKTEKKTKKTIDNIEEFLKLRKIDKMFDFIEDNFLIESKNEEVEQEKHTKLKSFKKILMDHLENDILNIKENTLEEIRLKTVNMLTIHSAKGLEWDTVFLIGMEENNFPSTASIVSGQAEEERRLCYVAITRAKKNLILSYSKKRNEKMNSLSSFLTEIKGLDLDFLNEFESQNSKARVEVQTMISKLIKDMNLKEVLAE